MAGVSLPAYSTLKANIVTLLQEVATAEVLIDAGRGFTVTRDRWRPWIESQQSTALVNVMVDSVQSAGGGTAHNVTDRVNVNLDMYVLGTYDEQIDSDTGAVTLTPADEIAAARLDLLVNQVRHGIARMKNRDLGFAAGKIMRNIGASLNIYNAEGQESTGCYAPARWSLTVDLAYEPDDDATTVAMTELNLTWKDTLESWASRYTYGD